MEDNIKKNASKLLELQKTLKGHSEIELDSFVWASAVSLMVLSDYDYIDIASDLKMDSLVPHWEGSLNIADSAIEPYLDYIIEVCYFTAMDFLHDYGHFNDVEDIKTTIDESIEAVSDKILLMVESSVDSWFKRNERIPINRLFRRRVQEIGEEMGSAAYDCMKEEQLTA
ncbi:MAG: hypothetical protein IJ785_01585 [Bacteroidales bacterium]|nr:hypothetical protein [Bacteroidales bacterium]